MSVSFSKWLNASEAFSSFEDFFIQQTIVTANYYPNLENLPSVIIPSGDYMGELLYIEDGNILVTVYGYGSIHNF